MDACKVWGYTILSDLCYTVTIKLLLMYNKCLGQPINYLKSIPPTLLFNSQKYC